MFEGFEEQRVAGAGAEIFLRMAGAGPPLLLIHGYPQTGAMWHRVAAALAEGFRVVVPDLRGYGRSEKPANADDNVPYSKRVMARDLVEAMAALGHERFFVAGHDRGARVTYRMALDHPQRVLAGATLDIIPTLEQFEQLGVPGAHGSFHWFFLAQRPPLPEHLLGLDPDFWMRTTLARWSGGGLEVFAPDALEEYLRAFRDPETIRATCDDYRAGATIDCRIDAEDRAAGRRIAAPWLALWGQKRRGNARGRMLATWRRWAEDVRGQGLDCGHFLPEEAPEATIASLSAFFLRHAGEG